MRRTLGNWAIASLPFLLLCTLVGLWHNTIPMFDGWNIASLLRAQDHGQLALGDFWEPHNEHRIVVPRLLMVGLAPLTGWSGAAEVAVSVALALVTFAMLSARVRTTVTARWPRTLALVATSAVLFSPLAWENWVWSWQIAWYLVNFGLVLALSALVGMRRVPRPARFAVAVVGAVVATLSLAHGALVWIVCVPVFLLRREWRRWLPAWLVLLVAQVAVYAVGYDRASDDAFGAPSESLRYVTNFLLRPLSFEGRLGAVAAVALLVALVVAARGVVARARDAALPWLVLVLFAVLTAGMTAVGRVQMGAAQANESRYTTVSGLAVIGVVVLLAQVLAESPERAARTVVLVSGAAMLALVGANYLDGVKQMERHYSEVMVPTRLCARTAHSADDPCVTATGLRGVWASVAYLREQDLAGL